MTPAARHWLAGLLECLALTVSHLTDGIEQLAEHVDPGGDKAPEGDPQWCHHTLADGSRHLYPLKDAVEHQPTDECPCGPRSALNPESEDGDQWLYRHYPLTQADITSHLEDT